jgi:DNA helicase-2/ATP-dependent DNA helicase PcrA
MHYFDAILSANDINEPNIMVVGDDDQAIMRFQGAEYSGMIDFIKKYNPEVIVLTDNYRSNQDILDLAQDVIKETDDRLEDLLKDIDISKSLKSQKLNNNATILHKKYLTPTAQYDKIANY